MSGALGRIAHRWFELIVLSAIWLVASLPLVTAPAMTDWLVDAVRRTGDGEALPRPRQILRHLRSRWFLATRLGLVHAGVAALLIVGAFGPAPGAVGSSVVLGAVAIAGVTWALCAPWSWVLLDADGVRVCLRRAYLAAVGHLSWSVLSAVSVAAGVILVLLGPAAIRLPVLLTVPALVALVALTTWQRAHHLVLRMPNPRRETT